MFNYFTLGYSGDDYYAFGSLMPGRHTGGNLYRYSMNGMERDDEITGVTGSHYTAEYWEYDSRLGRRWNTDPVVYAWNSPYAGFNNNPIYFIDPSGAVPTGGDDDKKGGGTVFSQDKQGNLTGNLPEFTVEAEAPKGILSKIFSAIGNFVRKVSGYFTGGFQGYGSATNSSESLARKGKKTDPFNGRFDMGEIEEMFELIKARLAKKSPANRSEILNNARKKFRADKDYNSSSKLTKKYLKVLFQAINENDVKANTEVINNQAHGNVEGKIESVQENANNQFIFDKDGELPGTYNGKKAFFVTGVGPTDTLYRREWIQDGWSSNPSDSTKGQYIKY